MILDPAIEAHLSELALQARIWSALALIAAALLLRLALRSGKNCGDSKPLTLASCISRLQGIHRGDSAIASLEFLMVFLPFLIIVMTVWQFAFMFNAKIHVGYSAYAAARSAAVMIPADLDDEKEGILNKLGASGAEKWQSIRAAAVPGVLPISPGGFQDGGLVLGSAKVTHKDNTFGLSTAFGAGAARIALMGLHAGNVSTISGTRAARGMAKDWYAQSATSVSINDKNHTQSLDFSDLATSPDTIKVTVTYPFWLNVPYVGRLVAATSNVPGAMLNPYPTIMLSETIHMKVWSRKRAIEPCP